MSTMTIGSSGYSMMALVREMSAARKHYGEPHGRRSAAPQQQAARGAVASVQEARGEPSYEMDAERWDGLA